MLTPMDIHNKEFGKGMRGYKSDEVDEFLSELAEAYETLYRENREMTDKVEYMEKRLSQYESTEETMRNTLVLAQETGENVKEAARKEANLILEAAEQEDANRALREAEAKYATIANEMAVFRAKVESILTAQLQLLDGISLQDNSETNVSLAKIATTEVIDTEA